MTHENHKNKFSEKAEAYVKIGWFLFIVFLVWFYHEEIERLIPNLHKIKVSEVEFEFKEMEKNKGSRGKQNPLILSFSKEQQEAIITRADLLSEKLAKTRILWIDDEPYNDLPIKKLFESFGITIDVAPSTSQAKNFIYDKDNKYNVIITDNCRHDTTDLPGILFAQTLYNDTNINIPVILISFHFTVCSNHQLPYGVYAATLHADSLIHYTFDAIERSSSKMVRAGTNNFYKMYTADEIRDMCYNCK